MVRILQKDDRFYAQDVFVYSGYYLTKNGMFLSNLRWITIPYASDAVVDPNIGFYFLK